MLKDDIFSSIVLSDAPLYLAVRDYIDSEPARFHMPGHKGFAMPPDTVFGGAMRFDVTELDETDSLYDASGVIRAAERRAASAFGVVETAFSAGGATLCIQAMLRIAAKSGKKTVVCGRNLHRSAISAMALLGLEPKWVWPRPVDDAALPGIIDPIDVESALQKNADVAAVYITSPDYYGVMSDIAAISVACRRHGALLLVDNAHGSHLAFVGGGAMHPIKLGADMCCDSAHKTLPVLTGGAYLQLGARVGLQEAKDAMALFGSTSPSYLIMLSLDIARAWAQRCGAEAFNSLIKRVTQIKRLCESRGFVFTGALNDPARLTLDTSSIGLSGEEAAARLREGGVSPEMHDGRHVVLIPSPFNEERDFEMLEDALHALPVKKPLPYNLISFERPQVVMTMTQAINAKSEMALISDAATKTAAECRCLCPPGVPIVMPGELITENLVKVLKSYGVNQLKVVK